LLLEKGAKYQDIIAAIKSTIGYPPIIDLLDTNGEQIQPDHAGTITGITYVIRRRGVIKNPEPEILAAFYRIEDRFDQLRSMWLYYAHLGLEATYLEQLNSDNVQLVQLVQLEEILKPYIIRALQALFLGEANGLGLIGKTYQDQLLQLNNYIKQYIDRLRNALLTDTDTLKIHINRESLGGSTWLSFDIYTQEGDCPLCIDINQSGYLYFYLEGHFFKVPD